MLFVAKSSFSQQLILGPGITPLSPIYTFSSLRLKAAVVNLYKRFGVYGMWELSPSNNYGRDAIGINYQVNCVFRIWAGLGVFEKGLINPQVPDNVMNGLRKEMGMGYVSREAPIHWELGYSFTLGPTFNFFYEIPLVKKDLNGDGKYTNIDRSIPCTLEWLRRDSTIEIVYDTIYVNPKPTKAVCEIPLPIDSFNASNATSAVFDLPLHYEKDQSTLNDFSKEKIKFYLVGILKERTDLSVEIGSHTPCDSRHEYNLQLSQRRCDTIKNYLVREFGASPERILAKGYGESKLVNMCKCEGSEVYGYTPYIDSVTKKQIVNFDRQGNYKGRLYLNYARSEISVIGGKAYVKCDDYQELQNDRITLRFKKKISRFAKLKDSCHIFLPGDSLIKSKDCRDNFELGSIAFDQLNAQSALNGIYDLPLVYEQNKVTNDVSSFEFLDSLATQILIPNPNLVVEIGSHTDCRQTNEYNKNLSQKRADSAMAYLIKTYNIDPNRIDARGYGEDRLLNSCNCEGSDINGYTPFISGITQRMEVELDARGKQIRSYYVPYTQREIKVIDGNPFVPCNEKQHRQNRRTTLRFAEKFADLCIDKVYIKPDTTPPVDTVQPTMEIVMKEANSIDNFAIEKAYDEVFLLPIFYDLDKAIIRPDAQKVLDSFAIKILNKYPFLITELGSHTDCRMPYEYNEKLARRRADSAVAYLRRVWNIGPDRIVAVGYGETQLMNDCHCEASAVVDYTPYIKGRTKKMMVELDDDGNVSKTIYVDYDSTEIIYFDGDPFVKCNEFQHRQNRRTTVRFTKDPAKFGIKIDLDRDLNNTNAGNSNTFAKGRKGGRGFIRDDVEEFHKNVKDISQFDIKDAMNTAYVLPIFYDLDKAVIRPDAIGTLDSFMSRIMSRYPQLVAELGSHTDCRMPYDYNVALSNRRADSAVDYLISRAKLDKNRVVAVGYGETQLINDCKCEGSKVEGFTPYIAGTTKKMLVELDDDGNVSKTIYLDYEPSEIQYVEGAPFVKCNEFQHRQNRRTTVRFATDPREFGLIIDQDVDKNNKN